MKTKLICLASLFSIFCLTLIARQPQSGQILSGELTITHTSSTSVNLSWGAWGNPNDPYTITVRNLSTNQFFGSYQTTATSYDVYNLSTGNTYSFSVAKNDYIIVDQTDM